MAYINDKGNGKYVASFCVDGRRKTKTIYAKNDAEAERIVRALEEELRSRGTLEPHFQYKEIARFSELCEHCLEQYEASDKAIKTKQKYRDIIKYQLMPFFGDVKLSSLKYGDIKAYLEYMKTPKARFNRSKQRGYAHNTIRDAYKLLRMMLNEAVLLGCIEENPCDSIKFERTPDRTEKPFLNDKQLEEMLDCLDKETAADLALIESMRARGLRQEFTLLKEETLVRRRKLIVYIAVQTAARRGEILGLRRSDIDLESNWFTFRQSTLYSKEEGVYIKEGLKTKDSLAVAFNDDLKGLLMEYYDLLDRLFESSDGIIPKTDLLFFGLTETKRGKPGDPIDPDPVSAWFKDFLKRHPQLPQVTFHNLRHSAISYMIMVGGVDLLTASKITNHASIDKILNVYGHVYDEKKKAAANSMSLLNPELRHSNVSSQA